MIELTENLVLFERVGLGGMAEVYRGILSGPGGFEKIVAVKRPLPMLSGDLEFRNQFLGEARIAAKISHPNISQIFQVGESKGHPFIVMEFIEGQTLKELMESCQQKNLKIPLEVCGGIIRQVAEGLAYAHSFSDPVSGDPVRVIHRDLTPHNIMVDRFGVAKILDFGIAKALDHGEESTRSNVLRGKIGYISPELLLGGTASESTDIFALGVIFYELLSGARLFKGKSDFETIEKIKSSPILRVSQYRPEVKRELEDLLESMLVREPLQRVPSVKKVGASIQRSFGDQDISNQHIVDFIDKNLIDAPSTKIDHTLTDVPTPAFNPVKNKTWKSFRKMIAGTGLVIVVALTVLVRVWPKNVTSSPGQRSVAAAKTQKIYLKVGDDLQDISPPELKYTEMAMVAPNSLSTSACYSACLQIGASATLFFEEGLTKEVALLEAKQGTKIHRSPYEIYMGWVQEASANRSNLTEIFGMCGHLPYCKSVDDIVHGIVEVTPKIGITASDDFAKIRAKLINSKSDYFNARKLDSYFKGPGKEVSDQYSELEKVRSEGKLWPGKAILQLDLFQLPNKFRLKSSSDCETLGDMIFSYQFNNAFLSGNWKLPSLDLLMAPSVTSLQIFGINDGGIVVEIPNGKSDSIFESGFCLYTRVGRTLVDVRFWVPKSGTGAR